MLFSFYWFIAFLKLVLKMLGGDKEIRTLDPLRARQVLSQLSYIPIIWFEPNFISMVFIFVSV